ncbi:hypothetical protein EU534_00580, partial [Candidatus Heimdallarchaeota archaeon]
KTLEKFSDNKIKKKSDLISLNENTNPRKCKLYGKLVLLSFLMGLILYSRIDMIVPLCAILIFKFPYRKLKVVLSHLVGLVFSFLLGFLVDSLYYKIITFSPLNWFVYNIIEDRAVIFGTQPFIFYFELILELKPVFVIVVLACAFFLIQIMRSFWLYIRKKEIKLEIVRVLGGLLFASFVVILAFSFADHKEFRLVYSGYIFFHLSISVALANLTEVSIPKLSSASSLLIQKMNRGKAPSIKILDVFYITLVTALILSGVLISTIKGTTIVNWKEGDEVARGLSYVGQQNDSVGVIVVIRFFIGEMYFYLHKDIPIEYFKDITKYDKVDNLVSFIQHEFSSYNYVILPTYQINETPFLLNILENNNFVLNHTIDNSASIYKYSITP